ncbi:MAG: oligosaccharide flippase family protein [Chloroflexi bacterium]|nr:oligosaccharide flippase family protein [Chloroflexota bacterium]
MNNVRRIVKNTTALLLGRVFSMGLGIVYVAALARYIQAAGMGKIATATSLVSILVLLANFGLSQLIIRDIAGEKAKASLYVTNAILLRLLLSVVFVGVIVLVAQTTKFPADTITVIYIYSCAYIFDELADVAFSIFNAFERMEYQALIQTGRDIVNVAFSLGAIYWHASLITIVLVSLFADLFKLTASMVVLRWKFIRPKLQIDVGLCRQLLIGALPFAALVIVQLVNRQIDTVLLSFNRQEAEVGWFSAANTLVSYLLILPGMFLQAVFPVFARFHTTSREQLQRTYQACFKFLLLLGFPCCIGTIVTADHVIALIYGPGFENAALSLRILALLLLWVFGYANGGLLNATGGQVFLAVLTTLSTALNVVVALALIPQFGSTGASIAAIAGGVVFFYPLTVACHRRVGLRLPFGLALKTFMASLGMGAAVLLALRAEINVLAAIFAVAPVVYAALLLGLRAVEREDLLALARALKSRREVVLREGTANS